MARLFLLCNKYFSLYSLFFIPFSDTRYLMLCAFEPLMSCDWLLPLLQMLTTLCVNFCWYASTAIRQAFLATSEAQQREKLPVLSCEHCPMVWYHKLCAEVEGKDTVRYLQIHRSIFKCSLLDTKMLNISCEDYVCVCSVHSFVKP
jgi:hypothetical protein